MIFEEEKKKIIDDNIEEKKVQKLRKDAFKRKKENLEQEQYVKIKMEKKADKKRVFVIEEEDEEKKKFEEELKAEKKAHKLENHDKWFKIEDQSVDQYKARYKLQFNDDAFHQVDGKEELKEAETFLNLKLLNPIEAINLIENREELLNGDKAKFFIDPNGTLQSYLRFTSHLINIAELKKRCNPKDKRKNQIGEILRKSLIEGVQKGSLIVFDLGGGNITRLQDNENDEGKVTEIDEEAGIDLTSFYEQTMTFVPEAKRKEFFGLDYQRKKEIEEELQFKRSEEELGRMYMDEDKLELLQRYWGKDVTQLPTKSEIDRINDEITNLNRNKTDKRSKLETRGLEQLDFYKLKKFEDKAWLEEFGLLQTDINTPETETRKNDDYDVYGNKYRFEPSEKTRIIYICMTTPKNLTRLPYHNFEFIQVQELSI